GLQHELGRHSEWPHLLPDVEQLFFGLAYQLHKHFPLAPTLATETTHDLLQVSLELDDLGFQRFAFRGALLEDMRDDLEDFSWALYRVIASFTRWLPCSLGNVSTTRCAGLTRPASIAAAAWSASSSSIKVSSRRLRNWANTSGSTKCSWEPST